jgi:hypothetical protein
VERPSIVALVLVAPIILIPGLFVWSLNLSGICALIRRWLLRKELDRGRAASIWMAERLRRESLDEHPWDVPRPREYSGHRPPLSRTR